MDLASDAAGSEELLSKVLRDRALPAFQGSAMPSLTPLPLPSLHF